MFVFESGDFHCFEVCSILEYFSVQDIRQGNFMTRPVIFYLFSKENFNGNLIYFYIQFKVRSEFSFKIYPWILL